MPLPWQSALPPQGWVPPGHGTSTFNTGDSTAVIITAIYCQLGKRYFQLNDSFLTPHAKIVAACRKVA